jgi:hypothetical protein
VRFAWLVVVFGCGSTPDPVVACEPAVLYLNRDGGDFSAGGVDDASMNRSVLIDEPIAQPRHLDPFPHDDITWAAITACVRGGLAPFPIEIVELDPGPSPHVELVFTTSYWDGPAGTTVIVPGGCRSTHQLGFVFGDALPTDVRACQMALVGYAQMTANLSIGDNCRDFLDLSTDCVPERAFIDEEVVCVDLADQPIECRCGGTTQNTFAAMAAAFPSCPR